MFSLGLLLWRCAGGLDETFAVVFYLVLKDNPQARITYWNAKYIQFPFNMQQRWFRGIKVRGSPQQQSARCKRSPRLPSACSSSLLNMDHMQEGSLLITPCAWRKCQSHVLMSSATKQPAISKQVCWLPAKAYLEGGGSIITLAMGSTTYMCGYRWYTEARAQ